MSSGYKNNNAGNLIKTSDKWEGMSPTTFTTADGNVNVQFQDMIYGLRALMKVIHTKISNGCNLYELVSQYAPYADSDSYMQVINEYGDDIDIRHNADQLPDNDKTILQIAQGIVQNEIPEYKNITSDMWQQALDYYNGNGHTYNPDYDYRPDSSSVSSTSGYAFAGIIMFVATTILLIIKKK